jgi:hypothetical protein
MTTTSNKSLSEEAIRIASTHASLQMHPMPHTTKLARFVSKAGVEIAIEILRLETTIYARAEWARDARLQKVRSEIAGPGPAGRHHHLNGMPGFRARDVVKFKPMSLAEVETVLSALAG